MLNKIKSVWQRHKDKWDLYLYLNGQCIKKLKVDKEFEPMNNLYNIKIVGCKRFLGTNKPVRVVVEPYKYKLTDKQNAHIEVRLFEGVDM